MNPLLNKMQASPAAARVAPFLIFLGLTFFQDAFGEAGRYWIYFGKTLVGAWLIWLARPLVAELKWAFSWEAVVVGIGVCAIWIGLDPYYHHFGAKAPEEMAKSCWNPLREFGAASALGWFFVVVRILGSSIVVPPIEEMFYRSFLYRFIANPDFEKVPLRYFSWIPFLAASVVFGFAHYEWLAGILCGMAYQWLVIRRGRLGEAMTAHAITNFLLGVWVIWKNDWMFW